MANSLSLQIINVGSTSSIYINDIHDGKDQNGRINNRKPYQYIPANGAVTILFTEQVQYSYESGAIRSFIDQGLIQTFFVHGDLNYTSTDGDGISNHLDVTFQNGTYEIAGGTNDIDGTNITITAGTSNGAGEVGGALDLNAGASTNGNGGSVEIRAGEGSVNGGGLYMYGGRGITGTAGIVTILAGDAPTQDGGDVLIEGGAVWDAGFSGGNVILQGGPAIDTGEDCNSGDVLIVGGGVSNPAFVGWVNNGGDVTIKSGLGNGGGHSSGDVILEPETGANGASDGKVIIKGANVTLDNYAINGLLGVTNGDGTVQTHYYGTEDFTLLNGLNNSDVEITINGAFVSGTSRILFNLFTPTPIVINTIPVISEINTGANFKVTFKATNGGGVPVGCKLFWVCI